jgi:tricorn protease
VLFAPVLARTQSLPLLLRDPSVSRTQIAFNYAGRIWIANRDGSQLRRLTDGGREGHPLFSPDGSEVAFAADAEGGKAIYVVPSVGGDARRLTYHPADLLPVGWTPDGTRILFSSQRASFDTSRRGVVQLFTVPRIGGFAAPVPLNSAAQGSLAPDNLHIAYVPHIQSQPGWKHYRGGQTTSIWIANLRDSHLEAVIPRENSNDSNPLWIGDSIYFLSDRHGPVSLFVYDLKSKQVREVLKNEGFDIQSAAASTDAIVYEQFGSLHLLDLKSGVQRELEMRPPGDSPESRPHDEKVDPGQIRAITLSPTGSHASFDAHGEIFTIPTDGGEPFDLTRTPNAVERDAAWSPDRNSIAYFSDESGEYELIVREVGGAGTIRKLDLGLPHTFYRSPVWSPDSHKLAYADERLSYWYIDLDNGRPVRLDTDLFAGHAHSFQLVWSPDSRWVAYTKQLPNHLHAAFLYSLEQGRSYPLTDGMSDVQHLAFDPAGASLYFTASTDIALGAGWFDMSSLERPVTRSVYALRLSRDVTDLNRQPDSSQPVRIDLNGTSERIAALPVAARNYTGIVAATPGVLFLSEAPDVEPVDAAGPVASRIQRVDLRMRSTREILDGVTFFSLSFDGSKMLYAQQGHWFCATTQGASQPTALAVDSISVHVDPRAEWSHLFDQVWRNERDFFYDPALHGVDVEGLKRTYRSFLQNLQTRGDLTYLLTEMLGNLSVSHLFVSERQSQGAQRNTGFLGADFSVTQGRYRIVRVFQRDTWNPAMRAPLSDAAVAVGNYLLAVNGQDVRPTADLYQFLQHTAGKPTQLRIGSRADGRDSREMSVVPIDDETSLRYFAWVDGNRRKVDELTSGRVAYLHLPNTNPAGYVSFNRYYFAQVGKQAIILDARYNRGGRIPDYIVDSLRRSLLSYSHMRDGRDITAPMESIFGPKALIVNQMTGSGGDNLAWMFRKLALGPLIGKRTWGGLVGTHTNPGDLIDGSEVTTPDLAFYNTDGAWEVENVGVSPDVDVDQDPQMMRAGRDPQLERAVAVVLDRLKTQASPSDPGHPPFPTYPQRFH